MTTSTHEQDQLALPSRNPSFERLEIDLLELWKLIQSKLWLIGLFLVAGLALATAVVLNATKVYQSTVTIEVQQELAIPSSGVVQQDFRSLEMLRTVEQGFDNLSLMLQVVDELELTKRKDFIPDGIPPEVNPEEYTAKFLLKNTTASLVRGSRLIKVSFDYPDKEVARDMAQQIVKTYIKRAREMRMTGAGTNVEFLQEEAKNLEKRLKSSEQKLADYTKQIGSISLDESTNIIAEQLKELNKKMAEAKSERLRLEADLKQIETSGDDPDTLLALPTISSQPTILKLKETLAELQGDVTKLAQRYKDAHPTMIEANEKIQAIQEVLNKEVLDAPKSLKVAYRSALQNEQSLEKEKIKQEKLAITNKEIAIQARVIEREIQADNMAYEMTLKRLNEEMANARSDQLAIQVVDDATPSKVVFPKPLIVFALAIVLSTGLGVGVVFLLNFADDTVKTVPEAEELLGLSVMGAIPVYGNQKPASKVDVKAAPDIVSRLIPMVEDPNSPVSEAFRSLRTTANLLVEKGSEKKKILVTSSVPGEGKSFCAINLAAAFAQQGLRILLVDADLRRPVLEGRLLKSQSKLGFAQLLQGSHTLDQLVVGTMIENLDLLPAGKNILQPSELLTRTDKLHELFESAYDRYDKVIVDSPPTIAVSDSLALASHFDLRLFVSRCRKTPRRLMRRSVELFLRAGTPLSGVVLNQIKIDSTSYYGYRYHEYRTHQPSETL